MSEATRKGPRIAVVGGSVSGLCSAILLEQLGLDVTVFERHPPGESPRRAGVGVDLDLLAAIIGAHEQRPPTLRLQERRVLGRGGGDRVDIPVTGYDLLRTFLQAQIRPGARDRQGSGARMRAPVEVVGVDLEASTPTRLRLAGGEAPDFDVVVGADGWRSVIRESVVGAGGPTPGYAGYALWRGLVDEAALTAALRSTFFDVPALSVLPHARQHFVAYPVPGAAGEQEPGRRRLSWGLYAALMADRLAADGDADPRAGELHEAAAAMGSAALVDLIEGSLAARAVDLYPVHELALPRLVRGGAVLVGDAAHLASPITGNGARTAMYDALVLVRSLVDFHEVEAALGVYETRRLPVARALVEQGRAVGWGFNLGRGGE